MNEAHVNGRYKDSTFDDYFIITAVRTNEDGRVVVDIEYEEEDYNQTLDLDTFKESSGIKHVGFA
jgi:hypothetical protein